MGLPSASAILAARRLHHAALAHVSPGSVKVGDRTHANAAPVLSAVRWELQDEGTFKPVQRLSFSVPKSELATPYSQGDTAIDVATGKAFKIQTISGEGELLPNWSFVAIRQCARDEAPRRP